MATKKKPETEEPEGSDDGERIIKTVIHLPWSQIWIGVTVAVGALGLYISLPWILAYFQSRQGVEQEPASTIQLHPDDPEEQAAYE